MRIEEANARHFDVVCAGETAWKVGSPRGTPTLRPGGGAVSVALALARRGLAIGVATVLPDDRVGRATRERVEAAGIATDGIAMGLAKQTLVRVDTRGGVARDTSEAEAGPFLEVPAHWRTKLLLLSGLSPAIAHAAALCKAARRARREGALVMIDFDASLHAWAGRDARTIRMVLREVDVAGCSFADLAVLGMDLASVRAALPARAVLVVRDGVGGVVATGPFGDCSVPARPELPVVRGDAFTAVLCGELVRGARARESNEAMWHRAITSARSCVSTAGAA